MTIFNKYTYQIIDSNGKIYFESRYYVTSHNILNSLKKEYFRHDLKVIKIIK